MLNIAQIVALIKKFGGSGSGGGSTASVQPDLNQNDPTAADYVKNRTHYVEKSTAETLVLDEIAVTKESALFGDLLIGDANISFRVYYDGKPYDCVSAQIPGDAAYYVGDSTFASYPFYIWSSLVDWNYQIFVPDDGVSHTVSAYRLTESETVHPLDPKYIPDTIQRANDSVTIPTGGSLTLQAGATVNDEAGVLGGSGGAFETYVSVNSYGMFTLHTAQEDIDEAVNSGRNLRIIFTAGDGSTHYSEYYYILSDGRIVFQAFITGTMRWIYITNGNASWVPDFAIPVNDLVYTYGTQNINGKKTMNNVVIPYINNSALGLFLTDSNGAKWKLVVGTDGTLTTEAVTT